ncbi:hypothetical protein MTO96_002336 [Rhipicephalus appendiculatus]
MSYPVAGGILLCTLAHLSSCLSARLLSGGRQRTVAHPSAQPSLSGTHKATREYIASIPGLQSRKNERLS